MRRLLDRRLMKQTTDAGRSYQLMFASNELTVHIIKRLDARGFYRASSAMIPCTGNDRDAILMRDISQHQL